MFKNQNAVSPMEEGIYQVVEEFETERLIFYPGEEAIVEKDDHGNLMVFRPGIMREYGDYLLPDSWGKIRRISRLIN